MFRSGWVCAGVTDELPGAGAWTAHRSVGGVPVLLVRDRDGALRAFLNVCRHRAAPLCDDGASGSGALIRCPYHAWLYRLDGSLAQGPGRGRARRVRPRRLLAEAGGGRHVAPLRVRQPRPIADAEFDLGPLAAAVDACPAGGRSSSALTESDDRAFNWKVLLENYSENYHTPFVHPEIDTSSTRGLPDGERRPGAVRLGPPAASRRRRSTSSIRATLLPGEPGWERARSAPTTDRPYDVGSYLTIWPNLMINVFPDAALVMWMEPTAANHHPGRAPAVPGAGPHRRGSASRSSPRTGWCTSKTSTSATRCSARTPPDSMPTACWPRSRSAACSSSTSTSALRWLTSDDVRRVDALRTCADDEQRPARARGGRIELAASPSRTARSWCLKGIDLTIESGEFFSLLGPRVAARPRRCG